MQLLQSEYREFFETLILFEYIHLHQIVHASIKYYTFGFIKILFFNKFLSGSQIVTLYLFFFNSFATSFPVSKLINLSFEIPPQSN